MVGITILSDCVGLLYQQLYLIACKKAELNDVAADKKQKEEEVAQNGDPGGEAKSKGVNDAPNDEFDDEEEIPKTETDAIKLELKCQMIRLLRGHNNNLTERVIDSMSIKSFYAGFGVLGKLWSVTMCAIQPNKRANWPRAAIDTENSHVNGKTMITSVCKVNAGVPSRSEYGGYQWDMRIRYEIRTQKLIDLKELFGEGKRYKDKIYENAFKWMNIYDFSDENPGMEVKQDQKYLVSLKPTHVKGKISLRILLPITDCEGVEIDRKSNTLPGITEKILA
jgi:hypothetical protein